MGNANALKHNTAVGLVRKHTAEAVSVTASESTTGLIDFRSWSGGVFEVNGSITSITWYAKVDHPSASIEPLFDENSNQLVQTTADNQVYAIPAACFGASYLYPVGNTTGTLYVSLKG